MAAPFSGVSAFGFPLCYNRVVSTAIRPATPEPEGQAETLWLPSWPLRDGGWRTSLPVVILLASVVFLGMSIGQTLMGILGAAALGVTMWRVLVPVSFEVGPAGVAMIVVGRRHLTRWKSIGRYEIRCGGILMLPEADAEAIDTLRGLYIPYCGQRDRLVDLFTRYAADSVVVDRT